MTMGIKNSQSAIEQKRKRTTLTYMGVCFLLFQSI